jgi:hypothetical protein
MKFLKFEKMPDVWSKPNFQILVRPDACLNKVAMVKWSAGVLSDVYFGLKFRPHELYSC